MSILEGVLIEEYDRRQRAKKAYKNDLQEYPKNSERYKQLKKSIRSANKDMRMIRRAIGPSLYFKLRRWVIADREYKRKLFQGENKE